MCYEIIEWFQEVKVNVHKKIPNVFYRGFVGGFISTVLLCIGIFLGKSSLARNVYSDAVSVLLVIVTFLTMYVFFKSWISFFRPFQFDFDLKEWAGMVLGMIIGVIIFFLFAAVAFSFFIYKA